MSLDDEIKQRQKEISTNSYSMSVGELLSLYRDGILNVRPEFQRFFRWTDEQKSRFIESLLLKIPVPPIFVSQTEGGKWDVVDGNQRLSTILELVGELKDKDGNKVKPMVLNRTKYLKNLEGKQWTSDSPDKELSQFAKLEIRLARFDLQIVLNTSDPTAKYELFDRLNTGGTFALPQESRNCLIIMENPRFFDWLKKTLSEDENFQECLPLTEQAIKEQSDLEFLVRFLVLRRIYINELKKINDLASFLTDEILAIVRSKDYKRDKEEKAFRKTFKLLAESLGEDAFKKFDPNKKRALGPVVVSVFEVMAGGIGYHCLKSNFSITPEKIKEVHESLWTMKGFFDKSLSRTSAAARIPATVKLGRDLFAK
ncbi:MAG: hypothetical protein BWK80_15850 [Desulfobacteraceae bacterium IS3]|nr:MAG: hypothetical protein BWK80_15850 [Desulfobacteraceae bacterium IS3]